MRIEPDASALQAMFDRLDAAHRGAADDTLQEVRSKQPRVTGDLADSYHTVEQVTSRGGGRMLKIYIVSSSAYADAVEHGANAREKASVKKGTKARGIYETVNGKRKRVGYEAGPLLNRRTRRGPHMQGNHVVSDTGPDFLEHMGYRLRGGNYSGRDTR